MPVAGPRRVGRATIPVRAERQQHAKAVAVDSVSLGSSLVNEYVEKHGGSRPIHKILIANNGMAAAKCILSMRRWAYLALGDQNAISFVAMATPEDLAANAEFIRQADDFIEVESCHSGLFTGLSTACM